MRLNRPPTAGSRIKAIREARGISQHAAARKAHVSAATWGAIERDESSPSVERAAAIARAIGATRDEIWPPDQPQESR